MKSPSQMIIGTRKSYVFTLCFATMTREQGEQTAGIIDVQRGEPNSAKFQIPTDYKVVDGTPVLPNSK